jgi:hypothetical protein
VIALRIEVLDLLPFNAIPLRFRMDDHILEVASGVPNALPDALIRLPNLKLVQRGF